MTLRRPGGQSVHFLEAAVLLPPHVVDLHGGLALRHQVQVLLRQVSPQLADFKLEGGGGDAVRARVYAVSSALALRCAVSVRRKDSPTSLSDGQLE